MTREELLERLGDIEWDDFELKEAAGGLPRSMWETVGAFSNTAGGWLVLGVRETKTEKGTQYSIKGIDNAEKMEQEIISTLRSRTKFNAIISCKAHKYVVDGKTVLAFEIPVSPHKPVAIKSSGEVYIRTGSGDVLASDLEVDAIVRDSAFGSRSEMEVAGSSFADVNTESIASYRGYLRDFNRSLSYPNLDDEGFCRKINIVLGSGRLSFGSLLMFGKRDSILRVLPNFWLDYMEIPGDSYGNAARRYTYRMPEQENIWESFQLIMRRMRNFVDSPYVEGPDFFGTEDNSQLFCLREGLVNFCAHSDYFAAAHPTIRVFDDKIVMQNPGRFILDASEFRSRVLSMPRNPSIIKFFRHAKLSENAGYGIDKITKWKDITGSEVVFESDLLISSVTYPLGKGKSRHRTVGEINGEINREINGEINRVLKLMVANPGITQPQIAEILGCSPRKVNRMVASLRKAAIITRKGSNKTGQWIVDPEAPLD